MEWLTLAGTKYLLKLDDDVFVNIRVLLKYSINNKPPFTSTKFILCNVIQDTKVKRSWRSKWRVSPKEYGINSYPPYCAGWAIVYSTDVISLLYRELQRESYFWIDDVHITGTLAKKINLTLTPMDSKVMHESNTDNAVEKNIAFEDFLFYLPNNIGQGGNFLSVKFVHVPWSRNKKFYPANIWWIK